MYRIQRIKPYTVFHKFSARFTQYVGVPCYMYNVDEAASIFDSETTQNCGLERKKTSIELGDRVSVAVNMVGNAYRPIFIFFQESYSETNSFVFDLPVPVELETNQGGKQNWHLSRKQFSFTYLSVSLESHTVRPR